MTTAAVRIVLVDDNPDDRALERRLLTKELTSVEFIEVGDAKTWASVLAGAAFDLVITDFHLGWSDGLAILNEVHATWPERPVIMVTGTGNEEVAVEALKAGAEDYVLKQRERLVRLPIVVRGALERAHGKALDRNAHARLVHDVAQQDRVSASLGRIETLDAPEATAGAICDEIRSTLGLGMVAVDWFVGPDTLILAMSTSGPAPMGAGELLPTGRSTYLQERAFKGPWIEDWTSDGPGKSYFRDWIEAGVEMVGYVPIVRIGRPVGLVMAAGAGQWSVEEIANRLPQIMAYAAVAANHVEPAMTSRTEVMAKAARVRAIIAAGAHRPVFQPIIRLKDGTVAGYEALTRFDDNVGPAIHFAAAQAAGVGVELELATLGSAMTAAAELPAGAFVSLNASSELLLAVGSQAAMATTFGRPLVLELTEHEKIIDDVALLALAKQIGQHVRLAIDDAGAGYAGLQRILQLRPAYIKLDIGLVRNLHLDPARAALIAGMVHFANETGASLIGEGIENEGERRALQRLGVTYGQGYLLGRPAPVETWVSNPRS